MSDAVMDRFLWLDAQQGEIPPNKRVLTITEPMAGCQTGSAAQWKKRIRWAAGSFGGAVERG